MRKLFKANKARRKRKVRRQTTSRFLKIRSVTQFCSLRYAPNLNFHIPVFSKRWHNFSFQSFQRVCLRCSEGWFWKTWKNTKYLSVNTKRRHKTETRKLRCGNSLSSKIFSPLLHWRIERHHNATILAFRVLKLPHLAEKTREGCWWGIWERI